jgi:tetratricopeptide (TPR) repeat protein
MRNVLRAAIQRHQAGDLGVAAQLYQDVVAREPRNAEALHLMGVLFHQQGDHARAVERIGQAVSLRPNAYIYHANLAAAHRALGDFERAAACCRAALALWPDYPEALCNLGAALQGLGQPAESAEVLRRALALRPSFVEAHNNLGIALRALDRMEEAEAQFHRAVALEPAFAPAQNNLGLALLNRGQAEDALPHFQDAVRLDPTTAVLHDNLGNALWALDRPADALAAYREAVRLDPDLTMAQAHLGRALQREGALDEALVVFQKCVAVEPGNAACWECLAALQDEREAFEASIPCWEQVLSLGPERAPPHLALGWALQEVGRRDEARDHYFAALRIEPGSGAAQMHLGGLHEELGAMAEAEAAFRTALAVQPAFALPHARLATLLRHKLPDEDLAALEARLADAELAQGPRARLLFGLAHALDGRGEYARGADCLRQANAITSALARGRKDYDPVRHARFVDAVLGAFDAPFLARLRQAGAGLDTRRPVFVFGLPRSGTTLIEQVLASHSRIHGAGELRLVRQTFEAIPGALGRSGRPRDNIAYLDRDAVGRLAAQHLDHLAALDVGASERTVDKMPNNYLYLGLLTVLFPRAVFIHCRRDLRDVALSCWMTDFRSIRWASDPAHIAGRFHEYRRAMDHWQQVLPAPIHHVDYQETVTDLESVARRLLAACGMDWEPACLQFHRTERPVRTASLAQVRQPVYQHSLARWKHYESSLADLFAALPPERERPGERTVADPRSAGYPGPGSTQQIDQGRGVRGFPGQA